MNPYGNSACSASSSSSVSLHHQSHHQEKQQNGQKTATLAVPSVKRPQSIRKAKSFHALGISRPYGNASSPELGCSSQRRHVSQENISPSSLGNTRETRERRPSALGLVSTWLHPSPPNVPSDPLSATSDNTRNQNYKQGKKKPPALTTRKSFSSFLRRASPTSASASSPSASSTVDTLTPPPVPPLPASLRSLTPPATPAISHQSSPSASSQAEAPSLPALDFEQSQLTWDLDSARPSTSSSHHHHHHHHHERPSGSLLSRTRSSSVGKWFRDAMSPEPPTAATTTSHIGSSDASAKDKRASMRRSMSQSSVAQQPGHHQAPSLSASSTRAAPVSMPSSPLAQSSSTLPAVNGGSTESVGAGRERSLTFALPQQGSSSSSGVVERPSSSNARRNSVASALHALNPFSNSRQSLHSGEGDGHEHARETLVASPADEPDLHTLLSQSHNNSSSNNNDTNSGSGLARSASRNRSSSAASLSTGGWSLGSVFGRRRASSLLSALNDAHATPFPAPETLAAPANSLSPASAAVTDEHGRPSTSSMSTSTSPTNADHASAASSQPSSRKPSLIFSAKQGTRSSVSSSMPASPLHAPPMVNADKPPPAEEDDTPASYLVRLEENCAKTHIPKLLASSADSFYADALKLYMARFQFKGLPIDIALRKLLMDFFLPKETQQIDRVMENFATRYQDENPDLFDSSDQCYILAFSLIMLHTDAFNPHNKNKMTKEEYTKNTRIDGIPAELLEYCYDNTVHAPYMFVDSPAELASHTQGPSTSGSSGLVSSLGANNKEKSKIDVYQQILEGATPRLRIGVDQHIPFKNPYSFTGTVPFFNASELQEAFARSSQLHLHPDDHKSRDAFSVSSFAPEESGIGGLHVTAPAVLPSSSSIVHYAKAGLLTCKKEAADGGKKASSRKWREWAVMLTPSQLVFFKDPHWVDLLNSDSQDGSRVLSLPPGKSFKPDSVLPLDGFVAVFDFSFTKRPNTFMLVGDNGRQLLMQAPDGAEMNEWIGLINWAASFRNTGIKLRTETQLQGAKMRRPYASSVSQANARGAAANHRNVYSTQGHVVGSAPGPDPAWEDDHVFEQFAQDDFARLGAGRASRTDILRTCIADIDKAIGSDKTLLRRDLQRAKTFDVMHPLANSTRNRLRSTIMPLAQRVRTTRLRLCRHAVAREVLARDLLAEERDMSRLFMQHTTPTEQPINHTRAVQLSDEEDDDDDDDDQPSHYELCRERSETPPFEISSEDLPRTLSKQALEQDLEDL